MRWAACLVFAAFLHGQDTPDPWHSMFDGKTLEKWREPAFTGHGKARIEDQAIVLGAGGPMTGVTWTGEFPKSDYEVRFEAARLDGNDFSQA